MTRHCQLHYQMMTLTTSAPTHMYVTTIHLYTTTATTAVTAVTATTTSIYLFIYLFNIKIVHWVQTKDNKKRKKCKKNLIKTLTPSLV